MNYECFEIQIVKKCVPVGSNLGIISSLAGSKMDTPVAFSARISFDLLRRNSSDGFFDIVACVRCERYTR
jgi:hypothetical protein